MTTWFDVAVDAVLNWKVGLIGAFVLSATWVHYRGRERHRFSRQLTDHSTFFAPINCLMYAFSAVPTTPRVAVERFPELAVLRDNWHVFREEAQRLHGGGDIRAADGYTDLAFNSFFRRGWKRFYLKWYGDDYMASARQLCPRSVELLAAIPTIKAAMFTVLPPGGALVSHRDPYAGSLRYHLGLVTPNDDRCRIYIDGEPYSWRDGEDIVFDETYIHRALNEAETDRIILFCDVERPLWFAPARWLNRAFGAVMMRAAATRNVAGERVGVFNRLFGWYYPLRARAKDLKKRNRSLYYAQKYVVFGGLLTAFILV